MTPFEQNEKEIRALLAKLNTAIQAYDYSTVRVIVAKLIKLSERGKELLEK